MRLLVLFLAASACWAQAKKNGSTTAQPNSTQDNSGAVHTLPVIVVASVGALPSTGCAAGELAIVTGATLGQQIYENSGVGSCVWTQQSGGSSVTKAPWTHAVPFTSSASAVVGLGFSCNVTSGCGNVVQERGADPVLNAVEFTDGLGGLLLDILPRNWDGGTLIIDIIESPNSATPTGTVIFNAQTRCLGVLGNPFTTAGFNGLVAAPTVTVSASGLQYHTITLSGSALSGCAAGNFIQININRATDTMAVAARVTTIALSGFTTLQ